MKKIRGHGLDFFLLTIDIRPIMKETVWGLVSTHICENSFHPQQSKKIG